MAELGFCKPVCGKLKRAVGQVLAAEDTEPQHFFRRKLRTESGVEVATRGLDQKINVVLLHQVVNRDTFSLHPMILLALSRESDTLLDSLNKLLDIGLLFVKL